MKKSRTHRISILRFVRRPHASLSSSAGSAVNVPCVVIVPLAVSMTMASLSIVPATVIRLPDCSTVIVIGYVPTGCSFSHAEIVPV